jgi:hypothetical protein
MKKLFLIFLALPLFGQTTYTSSKYKPVWYSSTYEKTHGTYALFDTSSVKTYFTPLGKPEFKMIGPTANTLFYIDSTGAVQAGTFPTYLLKANFDDSLNNNHTITGTNKFTFGNVRLGGTRQVSGFDLWGNGVADTLFYVSNDKNTTRDSVFTVMANGGIKNIGIGNFYNYIITSGNMTGLWLDVTGYDDWLIFDNYGSLDIRNGTDGKPYFRIDGSGNMIIGTEAVPAGTDSSMLFGSSSGNPFARWNASDGDQYTQSINTSDQAVFTGASGGYTFDSYGSFTGGVVINNTAVAPTAISGRMYFQGINNADADTLFLYNGTSWKQFISL